MIREVPALTHRVSTGPLKFTSEHWPGVYVRGDDAMCIEGILRSYAAALPADDPSRETAERYAAIFAASQV